MANLISVTVVQGFDEAAPAGGNQTQIISVSKILRIVSSTSVAGANTRIHMLYNTDNMLKSGNLYVTEAASALLTAANA